LGKNRYSNESECTVSGRGSVMRYVEDISARFTARHKACISFSNDLTDKVILDVGCWIGWYEKSIIEKGCKFVVGVDLNIVALRKAKETIPDGKCEFVRASAIALPFKAKSFQGITVFDVLEHLPVGSEFIFFSKANYLLARNGLLVLSVPNNNPVFNLIDPAYLLIGHRHYSYSGIDKLAKKTNFKIIQARYGGGIIEALSVLFLYFFKHLFGMEIPFKKYIEYLRDREYQGKGYATLFVKATKKEN
jgi:2-polyprenyl-3-methyl-5-hydroxy-6-metoxy-1,4-benzoquinol methylase